MKELLPAAGQSCLKFCKQNFMLLLIETRLPYFSEHKQHNKNVSFASAVSITNVKLTCKIPACTCTVLVKRQQHIVIAL